MRLATPAMDSAYYCGCNSFCDCSFIKWFEESDGMQTHLLLDVQGQVLEELLVCGQLLQKCSWHWLQLPEDCKGDVPQLWQAHIGKAQLQQLRQLLGRHRGNGL